MCANGWHTLNTTTVSVHETQSLLMGSLPVDQPFRYDGPVGSHGREAGFLLHSTIVASPVPGTPDSHRWRLVSGYVSAHSTHHMLALPLTHASNSGARLQPQSIVSRSSTQASRFCSRRTLTCGSPFCQIGRSRQADAPLLPVVQEILQYHSLVFRNPSLIFHNSPLWCRSGHHSLNTTLVPIAVHSRLSVAPCFLPTTCCALAISTLLHSLTQIPFDCASLCSRRRPTRSRPRTRPPLWWNDACCHALVARNGSWRDFRRSGSLADQARFRLLRQQFHSTVRSSRTHFWNEWLGSVTSLSRRAPRLASSLIRRTFWSPVATPDLCHVQWHGASRSAFPPDEARSQWRAQFSSPTGTLHFLTTSVTHSLSASRLSRPCTNLADLMLPSLTTNSLLRSPTATSLRQVRTAHTHSSKSHSHGGVIFCFPSATSSCASLWFRPLGSPA